MGVDYYTCRVCTCVFNDYGDYGSCENCETLICGTCKYAMMDKYGEPDEEDNENGYDTKMCTDCDPKAFNENNFKKWLLYKYGKDHDTAKEECVVALREGKDCFAEIQESESEEEEDAKSDEEDDLFIQFNEALDELERKQQYTLEQLGWVKVNNPGEINKKRKLDETTDENKKQKTEAT